MSQSSLTQFRHELTCFVCELPVGARYDRCASCERTFHLDCLVEEEGCPRAGCPASGRGYLMQSVDREPNAPEVSDSQSAPASSRITLNPPAQAALGCSLFSCQAELGLRYERCNTCRAIYHLGCLKHGQGCTTSGCAAEGQPLARFEGAFARPQVEVTREPGWEQDKLKNWGSESLTPLLLAGMWACLLLWQAWAQPSVWSTDRGREALIYSGAFSLLFLGQFFWHLRQEPGGASPPRPDPASLGAGLATSPRARFRPLRRV